MENNEWVLQEYEMAPWHVKFVICRLLKWANHIDFMGYDPEYFKEDIPKFVDLVLNPEKFSG
jgi:hypothetical protein